LFFERLNYFHFPFPKFSLFGSDFRFLFPFYRWIHYISCRPQITRFITIFSLVLTDPTLIWIHRILNLKFRFLIFFSFSSYFKVCSCCCLRVFSVCSCAVYEVFNSSVNFFASPADLLKSSVNLDIFPFNSSIFFYLF